MKNLSPAVFEHIRESGDAQHKLSTLRGILDNAIVETPNGWRTLTEILENGEYRDACPNCQQPKCEGCVRGYGDSFQDINDDITIDRWRNTWVGRISA